MMFTRSLKVICPLVRHRSIFLRLADTASVKSCCLAIGVMFIFMAMLQPDKNLYSVQPFYMCLEADGRANAVLFFNSNAMGLSSSIIFISENLVK